MTDTELQLDRIFCETGTLIDISRIITIFNAAKTLTDEEFDMVIKLCKSYFESTKKADPEIYYKTINEFKKLFNLFKHHFSEENNNADI